MLRSNLSEIKRAVGFLSAVCMGGSSIIGLSCYAKHTFLLDNYKNYIELQGSYSPYEPSDSLKALVEESKEDCINHISQYTKIESILVPGLKTLHAGTVGTHYGAVIGMPVFFEYQSKEDIDSNDDIKINTGAEPYDIDAEKLHALFLLSKSAKKYAIAREILLANNYQVYIDTALPYSMFHVTYLLVQFTKNNLNMSAKPQMVRFCIYSVLSLIGLLIWRFIHTNVKLYNESEAERKIATLGEKYLLGGIEYCSKEVERKLCLAEIKHQEPSLLMVLEDYLYSIFFVRDIPLQQRISYLKAHVAQSESDRIDSNELKYHKID